MCDIKKELLALTYWKRQKVILKVLVKYFLWQLIIGSVLFFVSLFVIDSVLTEIQQWIPVSDIMRGLLFGCYTFIVYRLSTYFCFARNKDRNEILKMIRIVNSELGK